MAIRQRLIIQTQDQYERIKARVKKGEKALEGKWGNPKYANWVDEFNWLAGAMLEWEIQNNLIEI